MSKVEIQPSKDESLYVLVTTSDKGVVKEESVKADAAMESGAMVRILSNAVKGQGAFRIAALTFLGMVYKQTNLDGFAGSADRETGKVSSEFKAAVRDAETSAVRDLVASGALKLKDEPALQEYLSALRDDKNYSNAKVTANRYFGIVGFSCVTQNGFIVPVPVMQARIKELMPVQDKDDTVAGALRAILSKMENITISDIDAIDSLSLVNALKSTLDGICTQYAEIATQHHLETGSVPTIATQALETAMARPIGTRSRVAALPVVATV